MEWNRRNVLVVIAVLVLGFGGGGVMYVRQEGGIGFAAFRAKKWVRNLYGVDVFEPTPLEALRAKKQAEKVMDHVLSVYPDLKVEGQSVPYEENGFLAILRYEGDPRMVAFLDSKIHIKMDEEVIHVESIQSDLGVFQDVGLEIERIAALPARSSENLPIPFDRMIPAQEVKVMSSYLLFKARESAMRKDEPEALRYVTLTVNLHDHLNEIECPNYLSETVLILIRSSIRHTVMKWVMPEIGRSADLIKWRELLKPREQIGERYASILTGETYSGLEQFSHMFFWKNTTGELPDPEALFLSYAGYMQANIKKFRHMDISTFASSSLIPHHSFTKNISRESVGMFSVLSLAHQHWNKGLVRAYVLEAHVAAALDLLIREKAGEDLSKLTETYVMNPLTEKPFVYDPVKRVLPADLAADLREIKLPW